MEDLPPDDLTITQFAAQLGITRDSVAGYIRRGRLESYMDGNIRKIPAYQLEGWGYHTYDPETYDPYAYDPRFDIPKAELWGDGRAAVVEPSTKEHWENIVFLSDIHVPYHDPVLVDSAIQLIEYIQPHRVVINGDTNDFFQLSRFNKANERLDLLQQELDQGIQIRRAIRKAAPNAVIDENPGNHEERLLTYPAFNSPALNSLTAMKPSKLLGLDDLEITLHTLNGFRLRDEFVVEHGCVVRKQSGGSAKARLDDTLISGIMGHTHRLDSYRRSGYRNLSWFEQGCLCMLNPDYVKGGANWRQGFAVGQFSTITSNFDVQLVSAIGRGFIFDGKHYGNTTVDADIWSGPKPTLDTQHVVIAPFAELTQSR